jgi:hypothetical protein
MVLEATPLNAGAGTKAAPVTIVARRLLGYKYLSHSTLRTNLLSPFLHLLLA